MKIARAYFCCISHENFIYVFGGNDKDGVTDKCEKYDIKQD